MANMMANMTIWVTVTSCCLVWMLDSHHTCLPARAITYFFPLVFGYSCQRQGNNFIVKKCANSLNVVKVLMVLCELKTIPTHDSEQKTQSWFKACMFANSRNWKPSKEKKKNKQRTKTQKRQREQKISQRRLVCTRLVLLPIFAGSGRPGNSRLGAAGVSFLLAVPGLSPLW